MTLDTYDYLRKRVGRKMSNNDWRELLMDEFKISKREAKLLRRKMLRFVNDCRYGGGIEGE